MGATGARRTTLAYGPVVVAIDSDDHSAAEWLIEFLDPWFAPTRATPESRVVVSSAPGACERWAKRRPPYTSERICFTLDRKVVRVPAWRDTDGSLVAHVSDSFVLVFRPQQVEACGDPRTRGWRLPLQRVVREIVASRLAGPWLDLHAAAVETEGRAILVTGPKRAGKTTLSLHLLRSLACRWLSNDRVLAEPDGDGFRARGMPTVIRVSPELSARFPELLRGLAGIDRPFLHTVAELEELATETVVADREFALSPAQIARQLGFDKSATAPIAALLFPEIRAAARGVHVERLEIAEASLRIADNTYGGSTAGRESTLFEDVAPTAKPSHAARADDLARAAPAYRVILGPDAYDDPDLAPRLFDAVLS